MPSPSPEKYKLDFSKTYHPTTLDNNNFSFGIDWNNFSQSELNKSPDTYSPGIFSFNGFQVKSFAVNYFRKIPRLIKI